MSDNFGIPFAFNPTSKKFLNYLDNRHLLTFGPTRSGKGATVIIPALLQVSHSVICIDPKAQNAAVTARRRRELGQDVHFLNPFDELGLGTSRFNPLAHLRIEQRNVFAEAASLSEALIIDDDKNSHWSNSARELVRALILHLIDTMKGKATLPEMRRLLTLPAKRPADDPRETFIGIVHEMLRSEHPFIRQPAGRFLDDGKEIASIMSTAITQTGFLDDPNISHVLSGNDVSFLSLKDMPTTIYLILPGRFMEAYARFFRVLVTSAIDHLTSRPGGHPALLILDEFASLQNLPAISKAFGFAAGYKVQLWPFLQDIPQIKAIYGDRWESFLANAGLAQFLAPNDLTTADFLLKRGGMRSEIQTSISEGQISQEQAQQGFTGQTVNRSAIDVPNLPHTDTMSMHSAGQYCFFSGEHGYRIEARYPYYAYRRFEGQFDPDPFHPEPYKGSFVDDGAVPVAHEKQGSSGGVAYSLGRMVRKVTKK